MLRSAMHEARKKDTRDKIQLGGLIVKAGLRYQSRALLLGMLLDAKHRVANDADERARLTKLGAEVFAGDATVPGDTTAPDDSSQLGDTPSSD